MASETDTPDENKGKTPFINASTAMEAYEESRKWMRPYFEPIDELERLARNRPSAKIPIDLPKVTDGTLSAIIQEQPKRIIQQEPSGLVKSIDYPEFAMVADYELRNRIIPMSHVMGTELQKDWNMLGKAMTWGRSTSYSYFTTRNGIRYVEWVIPYVKDILTEKGKVYGPDSNVRFMRSWYHKRDLQAIIKREKMMMEQIKGYRSGWNLKLLADFIEGGASAKTAEYQTPAEREKGGDNGGYEMIHAYQGGKGAEFYSFSPRYENGKTLRTKVNSDPRGMDPFDDLYCNIDLSSPLGRGQVELSGGVQNLIDQQMQMYQFITTMNMGPIVITSGNVDHATIKYRPNAIWKRKTPNDTIEIAKIDNSFINNYPNNYGLLKSQILNLNSAQDHSISSEAGNPQQSKTQAGVQAQESRLGVSDNYLRKQFEAWDAAKKETQINLYFSEMSGNSQVKLEADEFERVMKSDSVKYLNQETKTLSIPYSKINEVVFTFEVDPDSSQVSEDSDNVGKLTEVLKIMQSVPDPAIQQKLPLLIKMIIDDIGAEGTDELFPELSKDDKNTDQQGMQQQPPIDPQQIQQMVQQMVEQGIQQYDQSKKEQPKTIAESLSIKFSDLPEDAKQQVLQQIGITSQMDSPQSIDQSIKMQDSQNKADQAERSHGLAESQHNLQTIQAINQDEQTQTTGSEPEQADDEPDELQESEQQLVQDMVQRGFDDNDIEQGIIMLRRGMDEQQVMAMLENKKAMSVNG